MWERIFLTCSRVGLDASLGRPARNVVHVYLEAGLGEAPDEVLDLVHAVLVLQELDELLQPPLHVAHEQAARVA